MKIAVASGKGGTGKTTVAVNLALAAQTPVRLLDCDVEEPNAHLFFKSSMATECVVSIQVPSVDEAKCDGCGECSRFCQFNAIVTFGTTPVLSPELCHGCGGCMRLSPQKAIHEVDKRIGVVETMTCGNIAFRQGRRDIGAVLSPPLIRAVRKGVCGDLVILDAPPGTSCPVIATLREVDFVLLVTEPTPFGLHDLKLAVDVVRKLGLGFGVVINRATSDDYLFRSYLEQESIPLYAEIPDDRRIAEAYAKGIPVIEALPEYKPIFVELLHKILEAA